ncbi:putative xanthoxin dehydrogenase [Dioscorea sansibarensis]
MTSSFAYLKNVILKAEDIAGAVLYLGSGESKYVTRHNLVVDGGSSFRKACVELAKP